MDAANVTVNVGDFCGGWSDSISCQGDGRCNSPHTNYGNVFLRLCASLGKTISAVRSFDKLSFNVLAGGLLWSLRSSLNFLSEV